MVVDTVHQASDLDFNVTVLTDAYWPIYKEMNL